MFAPDILKQSLQNLHRILEKIKKCGKIIEVWPIYELLCGKFPVLDEKDLEKISDEDK